MPKQAEGATQPKLLSGGNPQIPKGYGNDPVQAYIAAMPGWKSAVGKRLDELIAGRAPNVVKAVKWNSSFYGNETDIWFLSFHCYTKYIKVAFFRGEQFDSPPPVAPKSPSVRYLHIFEDGFDESQFIRWVDQARALPGEKM